MEILMDDLEYLEGKKFEAGYDFEIKGRIFPQKRIEKILEIVKDKKVLHVGCCDHIPLIKDKINKGTWLHKLLIENCRKVLGIDINKEAIKYVKEEIGYKNIIYCNLLEEIKEEITREKWDYIILGEILEHTDNPVSFIQAIVEKYKENVEKILITVPNIYCPKRILDGIKKERESINSDHRYWFTPYTLLKVGIRGKLKEPELYFVDLNAYNRLKRNIEKILKKNIFKYKLYEFETLILVGKL